MSQAPHRPPKTVKPGNPAPVEGDIALAGAGLQADEAARYIAEFTAELSSIARRAKLDLLVYLLDMARLEAIRAVQAGARNRRGSAV